jgi:lipoate-protein ligase A
MTLWNPEVREDAGFDELVPAASGLEQMATDEARLEACLAGAPAGYRLYRFAPACLTLGRAQPEDLVARAGELGYDVARRPTGGRGLVHDVGDLTYAVALPPGHRAGEGGVAGSYRAISEALRQALADVGVAVEFAGGGAALGPAAPGACFEDHAPDTLTFRGRKLCGSAQARRRGAVLQHGSLPLRVDFERQAELFHPGDPEAAERLAESFCGLSQAASGDASIPAALARALHRRLAALVREDAPCE